METKYLRAKLVSIKHKHTSQCVEDLSAKKKKERKKRKQPHPQKLTKNTIQVLTTGQ